MIQSLIQYHDISKVILLVVDNLRNGVLDLVQRYRFQIVFFFTFFTLFLWWEKILFFLFTSNAAARRRLSEISILLSLLGCLAAALTD